MKTLKVLIALCFIFVLSTNNVKAQKETDIQTVHWGFTQNEIPCLWEDVSGSVDEIQSFTNKTYHVRPRGVLHGETSGEEYTLDYEFNSFGGLGGSNHFVLPMLLKHDGKLVAVIHYGYFIVYNGQGVEVKERSFDINSVRCK